MKDTSLPFKKLEVYVDKNCKHEDVEMRRTYVWCKTCGALWDTQRMPSIG